MVLFSSLGCALMRCLLSAELSHGCRLLPTGLCGSWDGVWWWWYCCFVVTSKGFSRPLSVASNRLYGGDHNDETLNKLRGPLMTSRMSRRDVLVRFPASASGEKVGCSGVWSRNPGERLRTVSHQTPLFSRVGMP